MLKTKRETRRVLSGILVLVIMVSGFYGVNAFAQNDVTESDVLFEENYEETTVAPEGFSLKTDSTNYLEGTGTSSVSYNLNSTMQCGAAEISARVKTAEGSGVQIGFSDSGILYGLKFENGVFYAGNTQDDGFDSVIQAKNDTWYEVRLTLNMDRALYAMTVFQGGRELYAQKGIEMKAVPNALSSFVISGCAENAFSVDDLSVSAVSAVANDDLLSGMYDTFDGYDTVEDNSFSGAITNPGWKRNAWGKSNLSFEGETDKSLKISAEGDKGSVFDLGNHVTKGKLRIQFSFKRLGASADSDGLLIEACDQETESYDNKGNVLLHLCKNMMAQTNGTCSKAYKQEICTPQSDKWYDVVAVYDLDQKTHSVQILYQGEVINNVRNLPNIRYNDNTDLITGIRYLRFRSWGTGTCIDNFSLEYINRESDRDQIKKSVNFDRYSTVEGMENEGWSIPDSRDSKLISLETRNGSQGLLLNATTEGGAVYSLPGEMTSGKVKIRFVISLSQGSGSALVNVGPKDLNGKPLIALHAYNGAFYTYYTGYNETYRKKLIDYTAGEAYEVEMVFNTETHKYGVQISRGGDVIAARRDLDLIQHNNKDAYTATLESVRFRNWDGESFIDNLSIAYWDEESQDDNLIAEANFEDGISTLDGWTTSGTVVCENQLGGKGKVMALESGATAIKNLPTLNSGKYRVSYRVKKTSDQWACITGCSADGTDKNITFALLNDQNQLIHRNGGQDKKICTVKTDENGWMTFTNLIDFDARTITYMTENSAGEAVSYTANTIKAMEDTNDNLYDLGKIYIRNWGSSAMYFDDLRIEVYHVDQALNISEDKINFIDCFGRSVSGVKEIIPVISTISLNFEGEVNEESLINAISLTKKNGDPVSITSIDVAGSIVTLKLGGYLDSNADYVLTLGKSIENTSGVALEDDFVYEFKTNDGELDVNIGRPTVDGKSVFLMNQIQKGDTLTVSADYVNSKNASSDFVWIIAYYGQNQLKNVDYKSGSSIDAISRGSQQTEFTLMDLTDVNEVVVIAWSDFKEMLPLGATVSIKGDNAYTEIQMAGFGSGIHVQGIDTDKNNEYIFESGIGHFRKLDMQGNIVADITVPDEYHFGDIAYNSANGHVYIPIQVSSTTGTLTYIGVLDTNQLNGKYESLEAAKNVLKLTPVNTKSNASSGGPQFGDGIGSMTVAPLPGAGNHSKQYLYAGVSTLGSRDNGGYYSAVCAFDIDEIESAAATYDNISSSQISWKEVYYMYTGPTDYGVQTLDYDKETSRLIAGLYKGSDPNFPNYGTFSFDLNLSAINQELEGTGALRGNVLQYSDDFGALGESGVRGISLTLTAQGICSIGDGYYYIVGAATGDNYDTTVSMYYLENGEFVKVQ